MTAIPHVYYATQLRGDDPSLLRQPGEGRFRWVADSVFSSVVSIVVRDWDRPYGGVRRPPRYFECIAALTLSGVDSGYRNVAVWSHADSDFIQQSPAVTEAVIKHLRSRDPDTISKLQALIEVQLALGLTTIHVPEELS